MGNNAWFEQNCDPDDNPNEQQEEVASGGGGVLTETPQETHHPTQLILF